MAAVSWVSMLKMWLWYVFWACRNPQKRFGITPVQRDVLRIFSNCRSRGPGEGRERLLPISFQLQDTVYSCQVTGDRWGQQSHMASTRR